MSQVAVGRYAKGVAKRQAILDAALTVFGEVGLHGASLREIASRVGVSHQSLMHYFPTKNDLLMAVLQRRDERLRSHFDDPAGISIAELISLARDNRSTPGVLELYIMASAEATNPQHPAHEYYREFHAKIVESLARYLERAAERGQLREGWTPMAAGHVLLAGIDGLQLQWLYDRDHVRVAELLELVAESFLTVPLDELENPKT